MRDKGKKRKWNREWARKRRAKATVQELQRYAMWRRRWYTNTRFSAFLQIAAFRQDRFEGFAPGEFVCRADLTPQMRGADAPCKGWAELDHINGHGDVDYKRAGGAAGLYVEIRNGVRTLADLRLLCEFHQNWNSGQSVALQDAREEIRKLRIRIQELEG